MDEKFIHKRNIVMTGSEMKVLIGLGLITVVFGTYHHTEKELKFKCLNDKNESNCIAGSFFTPCGTMKCFRIPGQSCRKNEKFALLYGSLCHPSLICNKCGQCVGTVNSISGPITNAGNCLPEMNKRNNPDPLSSLNFFESGEIQLQPIPSPVDV